MKPAAIGVRVHSGWGVVVVVSGDADAPEIVDRKHVVIIDPSKAGAKQPYHFAETLKVSAAEKHLADCAVASGRLALAAIDEMLRELRGRGFRVADCALLLAAGRTLPLLPDILASHALIHTAEGEFFRRIFREAFEQLGICVTGVRERELEERGEAVFGSAAPRIVQRISGLGRVVGSPWTKDEKTATLVALMILSGKPG